MKIFDKLKKIKNGQKGQANLVGAGGVVIGLLLIVAVATMILLFTNALNVQTYSAVKPIVDTAPCLDSNCLDTTNAVGSDINGSVEAGFDAGNTVAGFMGVIFLALLASVVIGIFVGFLALGSVGRGGGVSF